MLGSPHLSQGVPPALRGALGTLPSGEVLLSYTPLLSSSFSLPPFTYSLNKILLELEP